jgi:hypothetical protein
LTFRNLLGVLMRRPTSTHWRCNVTIVRRGGLVFALVSEPSDDLWIEIWNDRDGETVVSGRFEGEAVDFIDAVDAWFEEHGVDVNEPECEHRDASIVDTAWLNRVLVTGGANPAVMPGEQLTRLPGGDYQLTNGEQCWAFTPYEWVDYALEFVQHIEAGELARFLSARVREDVPPDSTELVALLDEIGWRADRANEGVRRAVSMWRERCRYVQFLEETLGNLPEMPQDWESEGERGAS